MEDEAIYRRGTDALYPCNDVAFKKFESIALGAAVRVKVEKPRNSKFFRKWWALVNFAFEYWTPSELSGDRYDGVVPQKDMERFRKDLTILSGRYTQVIRLDGSLQIKAKSISFASMSEESFNEFYKNTFDVVWNKIFLGMYKNKADLERVLFELNGFS